MEKYRQFADGGTGVNPFVPTWSNYKASLPMKVLKLVLLVLSVFRLGLFCLGLLWLCATEIVCLPLQIVPPVRRPIHVILTWGGCGMALMGLGIWFTAGSDTIADHRRLKIAPPKVRRYLGFDAKRGCIVLANMQGLTDVLYLGMKLDPVFVFPAADGTPIAYSLLGALRRAGARRASIAEKNSQTLAGIAEDAQKSWKGPVLVFPEGARTNGSAVLAWKAKTFAGLESVTKPVGTALVAVEYSKGGSYTPHHTVGTSFKHIFWLCCQPWHNVKTVWLASSEVEAAVKDKPLVESVSFLRTVLVRMLPGAVEVELYAEKHQEFMAFWDASQKKGYTKPSTQATKKKM
mmetsp:Transcript_22442/g.40498  ORF Transcript_22442/g.40498 Transcript_22442/m.40498 type:complete len:347 (+) Transcript_22442:90-1130(+)